MYSFEDRMRAVELYIKYGHSAADVIRELGYPSRGSLCNRFREFEESGDLRAMGYPKSRAALAAWVDELCV